MHFTSCNVSFLVKEKSNNKHAPLNPYLWLRKAFRAYLNMQGFMYDVKSITKVTKSTNIATNQLQKSHSMTSTATSSC